MDRLSREAVTSDNDVRTRHRITAWIIFCVLAGLGLRLLAAQGDLWQDEIWTFSLLRTVSSPLGIFLDMSTDNNHFLNTLYLYFVGPEAEPLVQRAFSILLGGATIFAVAVLLRRTHWSALAIGLALFAFGYPLVHYGSEARGYAGFLFCMVISIYLTERELAEPSRHSRIWLGISNFLGTLFQPIMVGTVAILIAWVAWHRWRRGAPLKQALAETQKTFSVTVRLLLIVLVLAVIAVYRVGAYKVLSTENFTAESFIRGYGGMLRFLFGIPEAIPDWLTLSATLLFAAIALYALRNRLGPRAPLYILALFALPAALFCARLPNLQIYRYYLLPSVALLLLLTELFALAWQSGGWRRALALALCAAFMLGNATELAAFFKHGRGHYQEVTRAIADSGATKVASNLDGATSTMVEFYAERLHLPVVYATKDQFCGSGTTWYIVSREMKPTAAEPDTITVGDPTCPTPFRKQAEYPAWGLSGWSWILYRAGN
jgi:hypothetical protein